MSTTLGRKREEYKVLLKCDVPLESRYRNSHLLDSIFPSNFIITLFILPLSPLKITQNLTDP
jgi:hypothetical protein